MRTLYRIESIHDKKGLFRSECFDNLPFYVNASLHKRHNGWRNGKRRFPTLFEDNTLNSKFQGSGLKFSDCRFAYCTIDKVKEAITFREMKSAIRKGFRLYKLTVKSCLMSEHQAIFLPKNVVKKVELNIETIYK